MSASHSKSKGKILLVRRQQITLLDFLDKQSNIYSKMISQVKTMLKCVWGKEAQNSHTHFWHRPWGRENYFSGLIYFSFCYFNDFHVCRYRFLYCHAENLIFKQRFEDFAPFFALLHAKKCLNVQFLAWYLIFGCRPMQNFATTFKL